MRKIYGLVALVILVSCAPLPTYNLPVCSSPEDAGEWIDQNIEPFEADIIASPEQTINSAQGCCIDKALLCLAMARQSVGIEGKLVLYSTPYGDHATALFDGYEYGYIEGSNRIGQPFSYRDAMGLIGRDRTLYLW
jgi:hypothetical protein